MCIGMRIKTSHVGVVAAIIGLAAGGFLALEFGPGVVADRPSSVSLWSRPSGAELIQAALGRRQDTLSQFYRARGFTPAWIDDRGITPAGSAALALLGDAPKEGLASYAVQTLSPRANQSERIAFELSLSDAMLRYTHDLRLGQVRASSVYGSDGADLPAQSFDLIPAVATLADHGDARQFLAAAEPGGPDYQRLKVALGHYRAIAAYGGWPRLDGDSSHALIARRLAAEGYPESEGGTVRAALIAYQKRNGLAPSGSLDAATLAHLNVPADTRAAQIAANMERWRWLPSQLGDRHIMVNIADASLRFTDGDGEPLVSRVVVGQTDKQTPLLQTNAVSVTVNPVWHVPISIVKKELEPKMSQNDGYLQSKNMSIRHGHIIQDPGPDNSLGVIKFEMPNRNDIYLHDTPAKAVFHAENRARSHGCVRVERIRDLAAQALFGDADDARLQAYIDSGDTSHHALRAPIPVYIAYWTALAGDDGVAGFRADLYQRDATLIQALRNKGSIVQS